MVKVNKKYISAKNNPLLSLQEEGECSITLKNIQLSTNKHFFQKFLKSVRFY